MKKYILISVSLMLQLFLNLSVMAQINRFTQNKTDGLIAMNNTIKVDHKLINNGIGPDINGFNFNTEKFNRIRPIINNASLMQNGLSNALAKTSITSTPYTNNFESYSPGSLSGQGDWVSPRGQLNVVDVSGDKRVRNGALESLSFLNLSFNSDQYAQAKIDAIAGGSSEIGVCVRCSNAGGYSGYILAVGASAVYAEKFVNGSWTGIAYVSRTVNIGDIIRISVTGNTIKCLLNGSPIPGIGDSNGEFTDTSLTSGSPGLFAYYGNCDIDDFECASIEAPPVIITNDYNDDFESYTTGILNGQGAWVSGNENLAVIDIGGDKKVTTVNTNADTWCYVDLPFSNDQYAEITMDAIASGADRGICVRASSGNAYVLTVSTGTAWLGKEVAGSWSNLDVSYSQAFNPGDVLRLTVKGNVLQALCNGVPIEGLGDANGELTDATLSTGKPGIFGYGGTGTQVDDFICGSITDGSISLDLTAIQETATCQLSGVVIPVLEFQSNEIYNISSGITAGKADLTIQSTTFSQHIQFDVDAGFNISNVKIEIEGNYIPLYPAFFNIAQDGNGAYNILEIGEIEDVCIYYPE